MTDSIRIAMWSGPRNLSTTLMRSFSARSDCAVIDEPFYAAFLDITKAAHPMREQILAAHEPLPNRIVSHITGPAPGNKRVFYQKHMVHHMVDAIALDWLAHIERHVILIRHPARVISSYVQKMDTLSLDAIGIGQQERVRAEIFRQTGSHAVVIDADRVLADPEGVLKRLCHAIGIDWDPAMLAWASGPHPQDGVWAPHWYDAVWRSTGFGAAPGPLPELAGEAAAIEKEALVFYERLLQSHI
jgi:hypothetical protein